MNECNCGPRAVAGMRKYHPTEHNSFLIGRPVIEYCTYCGKEKTAHKRKAEKKARKIMRRGVKCVKKTAQPAK